VQRLLATDGYVYLDVRSEPEFALGHAAGAYNIPLKRAAGQGMVDNPDFVSVVQRSFPLTQPVVLGCRSGSRSLAAARLLLAAGFVRVAEQRSGYDGLRDAFGQLLEPGWRGAGLPTATEPETGRDYASLLQRKG
jgi:rhodanese-related sulfurtransferase